MGSQRAVTEETHLVGQRQAGDVDRAAVPSAAAATAAPAAAAADTARRGGGHRRLQENTSVTSSGLPLTVDELDGCRVRHARNNSSQGNNARSSFALPPDMTHAAHC